MSDKESVKTYNFSDLEKEFAEQDKKIKHISPLCGYPDDTMRNLRLEALKIASDTAVKIGHFQSNYSSTKGLFEDLDLVHEIANHHLKYILVK